MPEINDSNLNVTIGIIKDIAEIKGATAAIPSLLASMDARIEKINSKTEDLEKKLNVWEITVKTSKMWVATIAALIGGASAYIVSFLKHILAAQ